jgi:hypothetical protein
MMSLVRTLCLTSIFFVFGALDQAALAGNYKNHFTAHSVCLPNKTGAKSCGIGHTQPTCKGPHKGPNGVMVQCD